jgi:hypothetical protein
MTDEEIRKLLERHVAQISENVTAVQIIAIVQNGQESSRHTCGAGCWYSRMGAIREFVINDDAEIHNRVKRLHEGQDDDRT